MVNYFPLQLSYSQYHIIHQIKDLIFLYLPKQHSQMGPSQAHPGPIWGPTLPNWGPTGAHMERCLGTETNCIKIACVHQ